MQEQDIKQKEQNKNNNKSKNKNHNDNKTIRAQNIIIKQEE